MEKRTMSFLSKLLGKKNNGCCGVVVEAVDPERGVSRPASRPGQKCGTEATGSESESKPP